MIPIAGQTRMSLLRLVVSSFKFRHPGPGHWASDERSEAQKPHLDCALSSFHAGPGRSLEPWHRVAPAAVARALGRHSVEISSLPVF